jgi:hypothetical protein
MSIDTYNAAQVPAFKAICVALARALEESLRSSESKVWHRAPVWFLKGNPVAGYCVRKSHVQLLFWSGQSFDEPALEPVGKFKAAQICFTEVEELNERDLKRWLKKARTIQWDYQNIVKRRGVLEKVGGW